TQNMSEHQYENKLFSVGREFWQILLGRYPHKQLCCSSHKCMFLTNVAPFKRKINRLPNGIRFIAKKHCCPYFLCYVFYIYIYIYIYTLYIYECKVYLAECY